MNTLHFGTLYGIGVGPGDPDLIPLKSVKIINRVDVIFAASSTDTTRSPAPLRLTAGTTRGVSPTRSFSRAGVIGSASVP